MNLSKQRRDESLHRIKEIRTFISRCAQDENTGNLLQYLSDLEKDVHAQKYGLVFEEHREKIDEIIETHHPVLTEDTDLFIDRGGPVNFLIEGDNLASLHLLLKTHRGKIDLIYIDPPYNTGAKNWRYNNDYVDKDDLFKHSKFSSFIRNRLILAKPLLSENGLIAVAIDDYEIHNVRMLLDEIFNPDNRLGTCVVIHNPGGRQDDKFFATAHEYMLIYAKNRDCATVGYLDITEEKKSQFTESDDFGKYKLRSLIRTGAHSRPHERPGLSYPVFINPDTLDISIEKSNIFSVEILPIDSSGNPRVWRWGTATLMQNKDKYILCKKNKNGNYALYVKERESDNHGYKPKTLWISPNYSSASAIGQIKAIFNDSASATFDYPKSLFLMLDVLKILCKKTSTILDFFAGSGTTGHAVMKLNAEDGGKRNFILCTNNENGICREITYERIRRVIEKEKYAASLKYYRIEFVNIDEKMYYEYADELLRHIRELVELENGINFLGNEKIAIVLTDEELEAFIQNIDAFRKCRKLYLGHDVLTDGKQDALLKEHKIKVNVIPQYYYMEP